MTTGVVLLVMSACAPQPTAVEKYCDVVHQNEAAFDPFSTPGAVTDPVVLRKSLDDQVATASALADVAPDAAHADATTVRQSMIKIANALAVHSFDAKSVDADPAVATLLTESTFQDARRRLEDFNTAHCT